MTGALSYLLSCQRYIGLNPVRAAMVEDPVDRVLPGQGKLAR